jgi:hypothetical protein
LVTSFYEKKSKRVTPENLVGNLIPKISAHACVKPAGVLDRAQPRGHIRAVVIRAERENSFPSPIQGKGKYARQIGQKSHLQYSSVKKRRNN